MTAGPRSSSPSAPPAPATPGRRAVARRGRDAVPAAPAAGRGPVRADGGVGAGLRRASHRAPRHGAPGLPALLAATFLAAAFLPLALPAAAATPPDVRLPALCEAAARRAAAAEDVPLRLLRAISLAETGRKRDGRFEPWPWTVNMEGEGRWFDAPGPLLDWVRARQAAGARSFDLGCFQVNHLWHGQAFDDLEQMLDPDENARYAARFLRALRDETGSWETAVGHYHSRTPDLASGYRARVLRFAELPAPELAEGLPPPRGAPLRTLPRPEASMRLFASLSPADRLAEARRDARADAAAASLAYAWLSAVAEPPRLGDPAGAAPSRGLLRHAQPLFGQGVR